MAAVAAVSADPFLRLLRRHHPRIARSNASTACSTPAHRDEPMMPRSGRQGDVEHVVRPATAPVAQRARPEADVKSSMMPLKWDDTFDAGSDLGASMEAPATVRLDMAAATMRECCPHCQRHFSKEAAERHVPICSQLKTRPKPPVKELASTFTDSLGRRHRSASRPGTAGSRPGTAGNSPMNVATPSRSGAGRASPKPPSQAATPAGSAARQLNMGEERSESAGIVPAAGSLSEQWGLLQFLLKNGCDAMWDDKHITNTSRTVTECLQFLERLEDWAKRLQMRKGALSRLLLPFDSDTSSNDQAKTAAQAPLGSKELEGRIPDDDRRDLVAKAVALRRLIRVKVADCNDVEQARESLRLANTFLQELRGKATEESRSMVAVLREL